MPISGGGRSGWQHGRLAWKAVVSADVLKTPAADDQRQ
jgi:hypothetical protein